ncbi:uncharacterized protein DSM5745_09661 [Aspergillus mulundensis]|uniref:Uncharacterized protein n=1 Tax=Aspergillus mulundensis TaxID=1810919 RepID=A0A3D8QVW7_9EURO|nr:hypothetical protein DSM5745_09661 [Aspergillus mulundensis]RDW65922.1 hypothetical protein DSM5745_09661 [Aspergillus mulundensis]
MQVIFFSNKFPVENPCELFRRLRQQSKAPQHLVLRQLLDETTAAIRDEIRLLPADLRSLLPPFQSILDLAEGYDWQRCPLAGTFECVFLCLASLGLWSHCIQPELQMHAKQADAKRCRDYETRPHAFRFSRDDATVTGLGLGFLAATAIVASPALTDVPAAAADVIRIAMRAGIVVYQRAQDLEPQSLDAPLQSWTTLVKGLGEEAVQRELDGFNATVRASFLLTRQTRLTVQETPRAGLSRIYISVVEPDGGVFINGPPSRMRQLFSSPGPLKSAPRAPLPVHGGPCHAAHLYDRADVSWVVEHVRPEVGRRECASAPRLLSMADGQPLRAQTGFELFEEATHILLTQIIRWGEVIAALELSDEERNGLVVESCGRPGVIDGLVQALRGAAVHDLTAWLADDHGGGDVAASSDGKIAVVGMSCRLPGADDLQRFWELLEQGRDLHQRVPPDRYNVETHTDSTGTRMNTSQTPFGCFIDSPGLFDTGFFDMSPREAGQTDPTHRLALLTAYEALEQSGYVPERTSSTTRATVGTIYGQCSDDYREANAGQEIDMYFIPGNYRAFAPGRISYFFKLAGPSFSCDTACSASLAAVQIACAVLSRGEANMVVAGGLNVLTSSDSFAGLSRAHFLSKTGGCKVFDDAADGYCRGDGVASLVLKRLADAQSDNDNILGVILATATNHSSAAVSITHPHAPTQEALYRTVLRQAGVSPLEVDLVEMHGTGTQAGDAAEMESVTNVFTSPRRTERLYISSVKASLGHGEAAAGVTSLIKALLIFQHNAIPRHIGIKTALNSRFPDLQKLNVHIPAETVSWPVGTGRKRYALVNNFSAAGGNTALLLEEPPQRPPPSANACPATSYVVAVSAKHPLSLKRNIERLVAFLRRHPTTHLGSLAYTTTARRMHHVHRIAIQGSSIAEIIKGLELSSQPQGMALRMPSIAFVFSGQGIYYAGIGHDLLENWPPYAREMHRLDALCVRHGFPSILPAFHPTRPAGGRLANISSSLNPDPLMAQLASVCVQMALVYLWKSLGVTPTLVIGASLGEYAALHAAGALSASDTIYLVGQRAKLMMELCTPNTHAMLAVQATEEELAQCVASARVKDGDSDGPASAYKYDYEVACINARRSLTIAATRPATASIKAALEAQGYRGTELNLPYAFHSFHMDPILPQWREITQQVPLRPLSVPLLSPLLAHTLPQHAQLPPSYLADATRGSVRFAAALERAQQEALIGAHTVFVEVGIHPTYSGAVRATVNTADTDTATAPTIVSSLRSDQDNWHTLAGSMATLYEAGVLLDWNEWFKPFEPQLRLLDLPGYAWHLKNYWIQHNGDWLLWKDKAVEKGTETSMFAGLSFRAPLLHRMVEETFWDAGGRVVMESDVHSDELVALAEGHKMCGRPVMSVFSYPDMALSLARYMLAKITNASNKANSATAAMNFGNVRILEGLLPRKDRSRAQHLRIHMEATSPAHMEVSFQRVAPGESAGTTLLATGTVSTGDAYSWLTEWARMAHLVRSRIDALHEFAQQGRADRLTGETVYRLFKSSIVDYAAAYRGIQAAVVCGTEAVAEVVVSPAESWWTAPPHHVDSIAHVAGFVMNAGAGRAQGIDIDNVNTAYVMEGWGSMRFGRALVPGRRYRSYVRMAARTADDAGAAGLFSGDVYVLDVDDDSTIIGVVGGVTLRPLPRILMRRFFDPPDEVEDVHKENMPTARSSQAIASGGAPDSSSSSVTSSTASSSSIVTSPTPDSDPSACKPNSKASKALALLAAETGIPVAELTDETCLASMGIDSLLSLVLVEKFALELGVHLPASFFIEFPTVPSSLRSITYLRKLATTTKDMAHTEPPISRSAQRPVPSSPIPPSKLLAALRCIAKWISSHASNENATALAFGGKGGVVVNNLGDRGLSGTGSHAAGRLALQSSCLFTCFMPSRKPWSGPHWGRIMARADSDGASDCSD